MTKLIKSSTGDDIKTMFCDASERVCFNHPAQKQNTGILKKINAPPASFRKTEPGIESGVSSKDTAAGL